MTKHYKPKQIDGEPHVVAVNPTPEKFQNDISWAGMRHREFEKNNPPIRWIGPELDPERVLSEEELEIKHQFKRGNGEWLDYDVNIPINIYQEIRRVATLKAKEPERMPCICGSQLEKEACCATCDNQYRPSKAEDQPIQQEANIPSALCKRKDDGRMVQIPQYVKGITHQCSDENIWHETSKLEILDLKQPVQQKPTNAKFNVGEFAMCYYNKYPGNNREIDLYYCQIKKLGEEYSHCEIFLGSDPDKLYHSKGVITDVCTADLVKLKQEDQDRFIYPKPLKTPQEGEQRREESELWCEVFMEFMKGYNFDPRFVDHEVYFPALIKKFKQQGYALSRHSSQEEKPLSERDLIDREKPIEQPEKIEGETLADFASWINNNWFIPVKDGMWGQETSNGEYQRTIKREGDYFTSEDLSDMYLNKEGEF